MKKSAKKTEFKIKGIVSDKVRNNEHHPFFVKKAEAAKAFLSKAGLPEQWIAKH